MEDPAHGRPGSTEQVLEEAPAWAPEHGVELAG